MGYLDRWCIDPLDPECPPEAPNHFRYCDLISKFLNYAKKNGLEVAVDPEYLKREEAKKNEAFDLFDFFGSKLQCKFLWNLGIFSMCLAD